MLTEQAMRQSNGPNVCMLVSSFAAALLGSADVRAEQAATTQQHWSAEKILPPEPGSKACWRRVYDAKHLVAHPQQKVTELTFFLRVSGYDAGGGYVFKNPDHIVYNFAISLKRRGNKRALAIGGDCLGDNTVECVVDCDGGGVTIDKLSSDDGLSISLDNDGIAILNRDNAQFGRLVEQAQGLAGSRHCHFPSIACAKALVSDSGEIVVHAELACGLVMCP